ncbi:hypothetical protein F2Q70_00039445 [Brassica cretica]|uniref:Uncharacterized protein n=1 Tax=Brassica cretica TaxID=69181 RepID=A0A8S9K0G7_BRACR|nr:hypothetical protein F2Q70_00039445 [Brassica cretica]
MLIVDKTLLPFFPSSSLVWAVFELGEGSAFLSLGLLLRGLNDLLRPRAQIDPEVSHSQRYTMSFNDASKPFSAPTWNLSCFLVSHIQVNTSSNRWSCESYQAMTRDSSFGGLVSHIKHHLKSGISKAIPQPSCDPSIHPVLHLEFISKSDPFE